MVNRNLVDRLENLGFGVDGDKLENYVASIKQSIKIGKAMESQEKCKVYAELLEGLKPESKELLKPMVVEDSDNLYSDYDIDKCNNGSKIVSINCAKSIKDLVEFKENIINNSSVDLLASSKISGYPVRIVYNNGKLSYANTKNGDDITRQIKIIFEEYIDEFSKYDTVEILGDAVIAVEDFDNVSYNCRNLLSCSALLLRDDVTEEELDILDIVCYRCLIENSVFDTLEDEMDFLDMCGFSTPDKKVFNNVDYYSFDMRVMEILDTFERLYDNEELKYETDGVVVTINNTKEFYEKGLKENKYRGNFSLRMGRVWERSNIYESNVADIRWKYSTKYIKPVLKIDKVLTETGIEITEVELSSLEDIINNNIKIGSNIKIEYNGVNGVSLVCNKED